MPSGPQTLWFSFALLHDEPHPGLAGYLAMVSPDSAEWYLLLPQLFGSGAARSAPSVVIEWQCHPSEVSHHETGEECGYLDLSHRSVTCVFSTDYRLRQVHMITYVPNLDVCTFSNRNDLY